MMDRATERRLERIVAGEVALTRAAALLANRLRSRRHRGMAQVVMETSASNTATLLRHLGRDGFHAVEPSTRLVVWAARMSLRLGDRWALRFLAVRLRHQRELIRRALVVVDESSHQLLSSRLVPSCRRARLVLRGDPGRIFLAGRALTTPEAPEAVSRGHTSVSA